MTLDPHVLTAAVATCFAGDLMVDAGLKKNMLVRRRNRRICPSCGLERPACRCL